MFDRKLARPVIIRHASDGVNIYNQTVGKYSNRYKQLHVYTNAMYNPDCFKQMFNELFKPNDAIADLVNEHIARMEGSYITATFRFQQLLGDFKERDYIILPPLERKQLIDKCLLF